jgi:hypothetical protein
LVVGLIAVTRRILVLTGRCTGKFKTFSHSVRLRYEPSGPAFSLWRGFVFRCGSGIAWPNQP